MENEKVLAKANEIQNDIHDNIQLLINEISGTSDIEKMKYQDMFNSTLVYELARLTLRIEQLEKNI